MSAFAEARRLFAENGLGSPPVPSELRGSFRKVAPWCYATRDVDPMAMYLFDSYIAELLTSRVDDYIAFCHAGHGVNSYAITYQLVRGPLAVIAQAGWGGGYADRSRDARAVTALFGRCRRLIKASGPAQPLAQSQERRLIVIESTLRRTYACGWLTGQLSSAKARGWLREQSARFDEQGQVPRDQLPTVVALRLLGGGS